jgi:hypothetical protein
MSKVEPFGASKWPHGSERRYATGKCRCRPCKDAHAAYARNQGAKALQALGFVFHGSVKTYNRGCRCDECRASLLAARRRRSA